MDFSIEITNLSTSNLSFVHLLKKCARGAAHSTLSAMIVLPFTRAQNSTSLFWFFLEELCFVSVDPTYNVASRKVNTSCGVSLSIHFFYNNTNINLYSQLIFTPTSTTNIRSNFTFSISSLEFSNWWVQIYFPYKSIFPNHKLKFKFNFFGHGF